MYSMTLVSHGKLNHKLQHRNLHYVTLPSVKPGEEVLHLIVHLIVHQIVHNEVEETKMATKDILYKSVYFVLVHIIWWHAPRTQQPMPEELNLTQWAIVLIAAELSIRVIAT